MTEDQRKAAEELIERTLKKAQEIEEQYPPVPNVFDYNSERYNALDKEFNEELQKILHGELPS